MSNRRDKECPDSYSLLCYTRVPTSREEANNEDIAFSMHLALRSHLDGSWTPLNENYGIFFAAGVPIAAATPESRRACTAAARFKTDPYTTVRAASDAVAHGARCPAWTSNSKASGSAPVPAGVRPVRRGGDPHRRGGGADDPNGRRSCWRPAAT